MKTNRILLGVLFLTAIYFGPHAWGGISSVISTTVEITKEGTTHLLTLKQDVGSISISENLNKNDPSVYTAILLHPSKELAAEFPFVADFKQYIVEDFKTMRPLPSPERIKIHIDFPASLQSGFFLVQRGDQIMINQPFNLCLQDGQCGPFESFYSCPQDCLQKGAKMVVKKFGFHWNLIYFSGLVLRNPGTAIGVVSFLIFCALLVFKLFKRKQKKGFFVYSLMFLNILFVLFLFFILAFFTYMKLRLG